MMKDINKIKAGFVQFDVVHGDFERNFDEVEKGVEELKEQGAEIAVLPEMFSCGFDYIALEEHAEKTPAFLEKISILAEKNSMVIAGSLPESEKGKIYNTLYVVEKDGRVAAEYRKIHLFSHGGEHRKFARGSRAVVADTSVGRLGLMICYDLRFPELGRSLADMKADIFIVSAQWPKSRQAHWEILLQARAVEDQLFVIGCNRVGKDDKEYSGSSMIIAPKGRIMCHADDKVQTGMAELDFMEMIEYRSQIPSLEERISDAYKLR